MIETIILFAPLLGCVLAGLFGPWLGARASEVVTTALAFTAMALSWIVFSGFAFGEASARTIDLLQWMDVGGFQANWAIRVDALTAVMLVVVTSVSALVHLYSISYMHKDPGRPRFFAYLSLFTFAMLMLVTADNFLQLFFGWEGVGLASYLLIGFWFKKPSASSAAIKAFVVNRVGDFGFALGIMGIYLVFGSLDFDTVFAAAPAKASETLSFLWFEAPVLSIICMLLFIGAMGKSAQLFLHTWLPDAMEGPTPVSALIHAATMVTAGVFLVVRCSPLFELAPDVLTFVTIIGAVTAFFAATVGLAQNDIKRVIAYSTCSQLGYMFFAAGAGAYGVAMFHLFTHAFFKALLFLGAGAVIHGLHDEQDMRRMGGLHQMMPITWILMLIGTVAITGIGIPGTILGTAGFLSKDAVLEYAFFAGQDGMGAGYAAFALGLTAALMTAVYSWRLIFLTFHGRPRADSHVMKSAHDADSIMIWALVPLAIGALFAGAVFKDTFISKGAPAFWDESLGPSAEVQAYAGYGKESGEGTSMPAQSPADDSEAPDADHGGEDAHGGGHHPPWWVLWSPLFASLGGLFIAYVTYGRRAPAMLNWEASGGLLWTFLQRKWYFDEIYDAILVKPARWIARQLWLRGDRDGIDRVGPNGAAHAAVAATKQIIRLQTGYLYHYAFVMLIGLVALATFLLVRGGL